MSGVPKEILDALAGEVNTQMQTAEEVEVVEEVVEEVEEVVDNGFLSYEEYIEKGGDPAFYRGEKAFKQQKDILAEMKALKKKTDDFMFEQEKRHKAETDRLLKEIEKSKAEAKADLDFERYEELSQQERDLHKPRQTEGEAPVIAHYRNENPELNPAAPEYDPVYASAFAAAFNVSAMNAEKTVGRPLNDLEISKWLEATAKKLKPQPVVTKKTSKVTPTGGSGGGRKDPIANLDPMQKSMYEKWMKSGNPEKEKFAKQMLKNAGAK